jgi:adenine-specific DNA-methyltransferase
MKYMGSKRAMLQNGLGVLLTEELSKGGRFVDLFTGSGAVAWYAAMNHSVEVHAHDLQSYGVILANAVLGRTKPLDGLAIWEQWDKAARKIVSTSKPPTFERLTQKIVKDMRTWSGSQEGRVITGAYGGHYFSPLQAVWIDALRATLPTGNAERTLALAALIEAASKCAAAPGHTAQPFQPTRSAKPFLKEAWDRDVSLRVKNSLLELAGYRAKVIGHAAVGDANKAAESLKKGDLVFVDPPYSGVHYSRFYHVLETIAQGQCGEVSGTGRYPSPEKRPRSKYSVGSESVEALDDLLETLASRETRVVLTFPNHDCSNGLSGSKVKKIARKYFTVEVQSVKSRFSTLGGSGSGVAGSEGRAARHNANELILVLRP